jgi:hypothetical protein
VVRPRAFPELDARSLHHAAQQRVPFDPRGREPRSGEGRIGGQDLQDVRQRGFSVGPQLPFPGFCQPPESLERGSVMLGGRQVDEQLVQFGLERPLRDRVRGRGRPRRHAHLRLKRAGEHGRDCERGGVVAHFG